MSHKYPVTMSTQVPATFYFIHHSEQKKKSNKHQEQQYIHLNIGCMWANIK